MTKPLLFSVLTVFVWIMAQPAYAQLPPNQPEQDCSNAIPVCQNIYSQGNSYQGAGLLPGEINGNSSCLLGGEVNDVWYIFTVQTSGTLCFSITPNVISNDYDWAVYNLTNNSCSDIATLPSLEVSCNFSGASGITGPNGLPGGQNNACLNVLSGETYVVNVSNWSGTGAGYTLDFSASTAAIFDNVPPTMTSFTNDCSATLFSITFSENIVCSTIDPADFILTGPGGPYTVTGIAGANCAAGGTFEDEYELTISPPISNTGMFYLSLIDTLEDNCGNVGLYSTDSVALNLNAVLVGAAPDTICPGDPTALQTSFGSTAGYQFMWTPGGMTTSNPVVNPLVTTTYNVLVSDPSGCPFVGSVEVFVRDLPTSTFFATPTQLCPDATATITYSGTASANAIYTWDFDGGTVVSGSGAGPYVVNWANPGNKNLNLSVVEFGCQGLTSNFIVEVLPLPVATFSLPQEVCVGNNANINFAGFASPNAAFVWEFGSGTVQSGSGGGPYQVSWNTAGTYSVCLTMSDNGCQSDQVCQTIVVNPQPEASIAVLEGQCLDENEFTFRHNGTPGMMAYLWSFDGAASSLLPSPVLSYSEPGVFPVGLVVTDAKGCRDTAVSAVEVYPEPLAAFAAQSVCLEEDILFFNQSTVATPGVIGTYAWNFGNSTGSDEITPMVTYLAPGIYDVQLIAETRTGCLDTVVQSVSVWPLPEVAFDMESVCARDTAQFENFSTIDSSITQDVISDWRWDFGDGGTSAGLARPTHIYQVGGFYGVSLTAISDKGCETTESQEVEIYAIPGMPEIVEDTVCFGEQAQLIVVPTAPGKRVEWYAGLNETTPFEEGLTYLTDPLADRQTYYVEIISDKYCRGDRIPVTADVYSIASGQMLVSNRVIEMPLAIVSFELSPNVIATKFSWDFGDGTFSDQPAPAHEYLHPGIYAVVLTVEDINGCEYEFKSSIEVTKPVSMLVPSAFSPNGDGYNDDFYIGHNLLAEFSIRIYNRWGQLVYESLDPDFRWTGEGINGGNVHEGVYIFHVLALDIEGLEIEETGSVTLIR